jgi:hypothetical protein
VRRSETDNNSFAGDRLKPTPKESIATVGFGVESGT